MKLMELTGIKHLKGKNPRQMVDFINKQHYTDKTTKLRFLGNGANAVALTDGTNVFKFWHQDGAYERFVKYCLEHQGDKFLPKFKSKIRTLPLLDKSEYYTDDGEVATRDGVLYVKMEFLERAGLDYSMKLLKDNAYDGVENTPGEDLMDFEDSVPPNKASILSLYSNIFNPSGDADMFIKRYLNKIAQSEGFKKAFDINDFDGDIVLFATTIFNLGNIKDYDDYFDLNISNFAMRGEQLVILDPFANRNDLVINREVLKSMY